jgi:hypothetical protein
VTLRNLILVLGILGIFFAFACPLAPTPTLVCNAFLVLIFVFVLALMTRSAVMAAAVPVDFAECLDSAARCAPQPCGGILRC